MKIVNFGSLNLDYVYQTPHFVLPGETLAATGQTVKPGGKGLNQSIALARAGAQVSHAGCVGQGGQGLVDLLEQNGVDTRWIRPVEALQGNAMIQVTPSGENAILLFGGSNRAVTESQIDQTLAGLQAGDYLVLQNEISCLPYLVKRAAQKRLRIVLNPSPFEESLRTLDYGAMEWLLVNEVEAQQLSGSKEPDSAWNILHSRYPGLKLVLTLGGAGAICYTPQQTLHQPVFATTAVDTTAAGDTFTGYFLAALTQERPLADCMRRAAAAAAISVSRPGASSSIPMVHEVEEYLLKA